MAETAQKSSTAKSSTAIKATTLGKQAKSDLPKEIFSEPFHEALVHEAARADLAARRRGTHSSLTRGEVAMTTAKAWRQKGTGRARAGALSVPHRYGGGAAFGPKPRHYTVKVNRKARRAALRSALSIHADRGSIFGLDVAGFEAPSTKQASDLIADRRGGSVLIVLSGPEEATAFKSFRNLAGVNVLAAADCGVADIVGAASIVFSSDALDAVTARATKIGAKAEEVAA